MVINVFEGENRRDEVNQSAYRNKVCERFGAGRAVDTPITTELFDNLKPYPVDEKYPEDPDKLTDKRRFVGSFNHLMVTTRPDIIAFAVGVVSRAQAGEGCIAACRRIARYIRNDVAMVFKQETGSSDDLLTQLNLITYSDSDFAADKHTRKSTSGYVIFLGESPIYWSSKKTAFSLDFHSRCGNLCEF